MRFNLYFLEDNEIVTGRDDKHLDFRVSVMRVTEDGARKVVVSTLIFAHNLFRKTYLLFVCHPTGLVCNACLLRPSPTVGYEFHKPRKLLPMAQTVHISSPRGAARPSSLELLESARCSGSSTGPGLRLHPPRVQDRLGVAVGLLAALEDEVAGGLEGDRLRRSSGAIGRYSGSPAFCLSTTAAMRRMRLHHLGLVGDAVVQPVGDVLAGDAQRGAVLHQADVVDVGHLGAADALVDPAHHVAEDALRVVVELRAGPPRATSSTRSATGIVRMSSSEARGRERSSAWRLATSTLW